MGTLERVLRPKYDIGAGVAKRLLWHFVGISVVYNPLNPSSRIRVWTLRAFGARIGKSVTIKPFVKVKFPWKLKVGDHAALGEECWIDNLDEVVIGEAAVVSQRTYLCTGNHDWSAAGLPLRTKPIVIGDGAWVAAGTVVGPGAVVGDGAIVTMGSTVLGRLPPNKVCSGHPAHAVKERRRN